eukprot:Nk52_evm1s612 gene=Nk52_evmTU1s612
MNKNTSKSNKAGGSSSSSPASTNYAPPLMLHFDINKTIIVTDPAGGKNLKDILNEILADSCWGYLERRADHPQVPPKHPARFDWIGISKQPSIRKPTWREIKTEGGDLFYSAPEGCECKELLSYSNYVDEVVYPFEDFSKRRGIVPPDEKDKSAKAIRRKRNTLKTVFTHEGQPGEVHANQIGVMLECLKRRNNDFCHRGEGDEKEKEVEGDEEEKKKKKSQNQHHHHHPAKKKKVGGESSSSSSGSVSGSDSESVNKMTRGGGDNDRMKKDAEYFYVLPSFFRLLQFLENEYENSYCICFRTFGDDIERVCADLKATYLSEGFGEEGDGLHAAFDFFPHNSGVIFRDGETTDDVLLVRGTIAKPKTIQHGRQFYRELVHSAEKKGAPLRVAQSFHEIYHHLMDDFSANGSADVFGNSDEGASGNELGGGNEKKNHFMAIRDYFEWWSANGENEKSGKVFVINPNADGKGGPIQILFDDNIRYDDEEEDDELVDQSIAMGHTSNNNNNVEGVGEVRGSLGNNGADNGKAVRVPAEEMNDGEGRFVTRRGRNIIDVRENSDDSKPLSANWCRDLELVKAEPFAAVTDELYFVKELQKCLGNLQSERKSLKSL